MSVPQLKIAGNYSAWGMCSPSSSVGGVSSTSSSSPLSPSLSNPTRSPPQKDREERVLFARKYGRVAAGIREFLEKSLVVRRKVQPGRSIFEGQREAPLTAGQYVARLLKHSQCEEKTLLAMLVLLCRTCAVGVKLSPFNVHRYLLTCFVLAQKSCSDYFFTNKHYASIGGVTLSDMNHMEKELLSILGWSLFISSAEFNRFHSVVLDAADNGVSVPTQ